MMRRSPGQVPMIAGAVRATGDVVWTSGAIAPSVLTGARPAFADEAAEAMRALLDALAGVGAGIDDVVKVEAFLADAAGMPEWNAVFTAVWPEPGPARTTIVVGFAAPGVHIELQAIAVIATGEG
jgi:2-iminobutanoate/2-iminopropanoate deaminase